MVLQTEIPLETVTEVNEAGVSKEVERKVFPGYVLLKMVLTDDTWHLIRNIRGVTGFVGEANKAIPLTDEEVAALGVEKREIVVQYHVGDTVRITDGPLSSFTGTVEEIEPEKEPRPRCRLHVQQRDDRRSGAGSGRSPVLTGTGQAQAGVLPSGASGRDESRLAKKRPGIGRPLPHFYEGGAYPWHRKLLVMSSCRFLQAKQPRTPRWPCSGPARRQHRRVHQGV